tara:strand:- start:532 stop:1785 length:1254 start_codon:yes stop_codon:yes gene_type:complete
VLSVLRLLLIAPENSYRTAAYCGAVQRLGFECFIASATRYPIPSAGLTGIALESLCTPDAVSVIATQHKRTPFDGVIGTDDTSVELAAEVAERLGLRGNTVDSVRAATRKDLSRKILSRCGIAVPGHRLVELKNRTPNSLDEVAYPCVCKPTRLSASRGVIRADNPAELEYALERIEKLLMAEVRDPELVALIEDYIPGQEIAVEGLLDDGELTLLAVFDKPNPLNGPYFEETMYVTPSRQNKSILSAVQNQLAIACRELGLRWGPIHAECRLNESGSWIIEIACRTIGGRCGQLLESSTGRTLEEIIITNAVGQKADCRLDVEAAGVMMIPVPGRGGVVRRVEGIGEAARIPLVSSVEIDVRPGQMLVPWPEGCPYPGFIFANGEDPESVENALNAAHQQLDIILAPVLPLQVTND